MSETQSVGGLLPEEGGERNAGPFGDGVWPLDVGSFPQVRSHFGLLDLSGGMAEWLETEQANSSVGQRRYQGGTNHGEYWSDDPLNFDRIDFYHAGYVDSVSPQAGLRLASAEPCRADLAPPTGILDAADVTAFVDRYLSADPAADLAEPLGVINFFDIARFLEDYNAGCAGSP